jgi:pilus assembly protein CpaC
MTLTRQKALAGVWMFIIVVLHATVLSAQVNPAPVAAVTASAAVPAPAAAAPASPAVPADTPPTAGAAVETASISLLVGRSTVVNLTEPITRVALTSADIADALVTSTTQLLVHGKAPGTISMFVWNRDGAIRRYEVTVGRDVARLSAELRDIFPAERITVRSNGRDIVLSGTVSTKDVVERAGNLSTGFVDKKEEIVNLLQVQAQKTNQVLLHVRFAEVSRSALTELGASLFTSATGIRNTLGRVTTQQFPSAGYDKLETTKADNSFGGDVTSAKGDITFSDFLNLFILSEKYDLGVLIRALQSRGLFQSLAEPNLVAESGKSATFLAGGEIPIPVAQGSGANLAISVQFKEFGIRLGFTPVVDGDRIHLHVAPEVSSLDFTNAVVLQGFRIPALSTRRTETELELRDGQTFAIAGLLNNTMSSTLQKIPGIGDIPILGYLFKSKAAQKNRTELVVMITPEILREGSHGVTGDLPRQAEPYLSPLPEKKSFAPPPAAFEPGLPSQLK